MITTTVNHFIAMISVLPECPANQIFLSLLNTLGGMDFYSQLPGEPTRTQRAEIPGAYRRWDMQANYGAWGGCRIVIWLLHFPLGDLGQGMVPLSLYLSICKMGIITQLEFRDFYGLTQ